MKKISMILVAMLATLSMKAVEFWPSDSVNPEMPGFHMVLSERNMEDVVNLIDFILNPHPICESQIRYVDFNCDNEVDMRDVTDLLDFLLTGYYYDPDDPSTWER